MLAGLSVACSAVVLLLLKPFVAWWLEDTLSHDGALALCLPISAVGSSLTGIASMYMSTEGLLRMNSLIYLAGTVAALALKFVLLPKLGAAGLVLGSAIGYFFCYTIVVYFVARKEATVGKS